MLNQLLFELSRVPLWALAMLVNLLAAVFCAVFIMHDADSPSTFRTSLVSVACMVIAAMVGIVIVLALFIVHAVETLAWRRRQATSPRRVP